MGQEAIEAEDARARGEDVPVPRYAAYSVWRPLATVKRDPLAVCDYRTIEKETASKHKYRSLSEQNPDGKYVMEYWHIGIPKDPNQAQWYWMPEQTPEDVLVLKFADSAAETDPSIARYCAHASPHVMGTQNEEARMSIESRVITFWEQTAQGDAHDRGIRRRRSIYDNRASQADVSVNVLHQPDSISRLASSRNYSSDTWKLTLFRRIVRNGVVDGPLCYFAKREIYSMLYACHRYRCPRVRLHLLHMSNALAMYES